MGLERKIDIGIAGLKELARTTWQQAVTRGMSGMEPDETKMFEDWWATTVKLNGWTL